MIKYVEALAKLELQEKEEEQVKKDLENILAFMETMNELDTTGIEPMSHVFPLKNVYREDELLNVDRKDELLANAPAKKDGCFMVPKTVE